MTQMGVISGDRLVHEPGTGEGQGRRFGQSVEAGEPVPLFDTHIGGAVQGNLRQQYMVSPDGQRFLMNTFPDEALASPITVILNWAGTAKK